MIILFLSTFCFSSISSLVRHFGTAVVANKDDGYTIGSANSNSGATASDSTDAYNAMRSRRQSTLNSSTLSAVAESGGFVASVTSSRYVCLCEYEANARSQLKDSISLDVYLTSSTH